jgi:beta-1,4-mannosyltransferase
MFSDYQYTRHVNSIRIFMAISIIVISIGLIIGYHAFFPQGRHAENYLEHVWASLHYWWAAGVPACGLGLAGMCLYRRRELIDISVVHNLVIFRIVSLGRNVDALSTSIKHISEQMKKTSVFDFRIEVLVEQGQPFCDVPSNFEHTRIIVVPKSYTLKSGTMKKARALHYGQQVCDAPDNTWIVHLDEESRPSTSMILGIAKAIAEEEKNSRHRIGQGAIVYFRHWTQGRYRWWTLLDSGRTGQDVGPFYFQAKLGTSLYGFHGSWILIRKSVATAIPNGFDLGKQGSITEDAWWCLIANAHGHKIRWVEGYCEEQSVRSFRDFCKQRGRWFYGLRLVGKHTPVSWLRRAPIQINLFLWIMVWASIPFSIVHLYFGYEMSKWLLVVIAISLGSYFTMILAGLWINLKLAGLGQWWRYVLLTVLQILILPVFVCMEIFAAIVYGMIIPDRDDFHVIEK